MEWVFFSQADGSLESDPTLNWKIEPCCTESTYLEKEMCKHKERDL